MSVIEKMGVIEKVDGLPSASQLLKSAWALYKEKFSLLTSIALAPALAILLVQILAMLANPSDAEASKGLETAVTVISWLLSLWMQAALIHALATPEQADTFQKAYSLGKKKFIMLLLTGILVGLAVGAGTLLFIIPGIIFALWFSLTNYVVVEEGIGEVKAMKASRQYVIGRTNAVFWRWICMGVVVGVVSIILALIISLIPVNENAQNLILQIPLSLFIAPWGVAYGYLLYSHLKRLPRIAKNEKAAS